MDFIEMIANLRPLLQNNEMEVALYVINDHTLLLLGLYL